MPQSTKSSLDSRPDSFENDLAKSVRAAEALGQVQALDAREMSFAVVIHGYPFGDMLCRNGRFAKDYAECIHLGVIRDSHLASSFQR
jgi:hypothetical protein